MTKIELTLAPDYVPTWTIVDAVRELFQNALDQETQSPDNKADWSYDKDRQTLTISNATSKLTARTLLLGSTTKRNDEATIGQFGEGYKIATLVLLRSGKQVTFFNYGAREIWRPRFVKSRRFDSEILTFFIEKPKIWERVPSADLVIEVQGITPDEYYEQIVPSNLHLRKNYVVMQKSDYGEVVSLPGKVFVNGLFVCDYEPYTYGYNFKPGTLRLDRDRKMASDFDLRWAASAMWARCKDSDKVMELVTKGASDVAYLSSLCDLHERHKWSAEAIKRFRSVYGDEALPITCQEELSKVPKGRRGVIVPQTYYDLITRDDSFEWPIDPEGDLFERLEAWYDSIAWRLQADEEAEFKKILQAIKDRYAPLSE